jgi:cell wall-associated NlpC family hydrolase
MKYDDLLSIPYVQGGRDPKNGLDCWGLCIEIYRRVGRELPDFQGSVDETPDIMESHIPKFEQLPGPEPYALVAFRIYGPFVNHVGVVLPDGREERSAPPTSFIHHFKGRSVAVESLNHIIWKSRIAGFYRYRGY